MSTPNTLSTQESSTTPVMGGVQQITDDTNAASQSKNVVEPDNIEDDDNNPYGPNKRKRTSKRIPFESALPCRHGMKCILCDWKFDELYCNMAIMSSYCFNTKGRDSPCIISSKPCMIAFCVIEVILSQIPNFDQIWWFSIIAAVMSFTYSTIGLVIGISKLEGKGIHMQTLINGATYIIVGDTTRNLSYFEGGRRH